MKMKCTFAAAVLAVAGFAPSAQAAVLYEHTFAAPAPPQTIAATGWVLDAPYVGGFGGSSYNGTYAGGGLTDADSAQPINGNTGVYLGRGGVLTAVPGIFYTTDGVAGFNAFDPATCPGCTFNVYANTQAGGADDFGYFAIQAGVTGRDAKWYISSTSMAAPTVNEGTTMNLRSLAYAGAAWNDLTVDPTGVADPVIGGAAVIPAGSSIFGVGIVQVITNPAPTPTFDNPTAFSSWNYADYKITCIPEPGALMLFAIGATAVLAVRRRDE